MITENSTDAERFTRRTANARMVKSAALILFMFEVSVYADKPANDVGNHKVTWIGNSLSRGEITNDERSYVQHWIWGIGVKRKQAFMQKALSNDESTAAMGRERPPIDRLNQE